MRSCLYIRALAYRKGITCDTLVFTVDAIKHRERTRLHKHLYVMCFHQNRGVQNRADKKRGVGSLWEAVQNGAQKEKGVGLRSTYVSQICGGG